MEILVFQDGPSSFGLPLAEIKEICNLRRLLPLPFASSYVVGLANLRGQVEPIVSPYLLQGGSGRYRMDIEYACMIEAVGMQAAVACHKILGVKSVDVEAPSKPSAICQTVSIDSKRVKILLVENFIRAASDSLLDSRFSLNV